jgi:hypothetical protein
LEDIFNKLIVNGVTGGAFANIRPVASNSPVEDVSSIDMRCNVGGASGSGTTTTTFPAGSTVSSYDKHLDVNFKLITDDAL